MSASAPVPPVAPSSNPSRKSRGGRRKGHREMEHITNEAPASVVSDDSVPVCWICAEPVKFYSLSECNHRTCHVCAIRLRALYKRLDCTFCKHPQTNLIFTHSADKPFDTFTLEIIPFKDPKLSVYFETQDIMEETLILLRFNCPDSTCDFIASGWGDLKMHVRAIHSRSMCDMCIRFKKIFAHEHVLYQPPQLPLHLPSILHRAPRKDRAPDKVEGGVHPMCDFCRECYFGDDELFAHMRERHEECFLCKREGIRDQYFLDYAGLERHFDSVHFSCKDAQCQAQKFVVFGSALDLKAHMVEQHGSEMTSRGKKDVRRIETNFEYEDSGGSNRGQGRNRARDRDREPPEPRSRRRDGFGASLTGSAQSAALAHQVLRSEQEQNAAADVDPVVAERHAAFFARVNTLTSDSTAAVSAVRSAIRSYRSSESGPRDLISTFYNVVDQDLDGTASLISSLVELLDGEEKRRALLAAWNGFKIEQRQFPDLIPSAPGAEYAGVAGGRILNVKHSAAVRPSSKQSPRQVWDRVAQVAASTSAQPSPAPGRRPSERFPSLAAPKAPAFRQPQHNTAWSAAASSSAPRPAQAAGANLRPSDPPHPTPLNMSPTLFPTLPLSAAQSHVRPALSGNQSLRHILGETGAPTLNAWGGKKGEGSPSGPGAAVDVSADAVPDGGSTENRSKKKGKGKQMLFTLGTFPT